MPWESLVHHANVKKQKVNNNFKCISKLITTARMSTERSFFLPNNLILKK